MAHPKNRKQVNLPEPLWDQVFRRVSAINASPTSDTSRPMTITAYVVEATEQRLDRELATNNGPNPLEV